MAFFHHIRKYPVSIFLFAAVVYLSLFRPPRIELVHEIPLWDKWVHFVMYGGWATVLWSEFFRNHRRPYPKTEGWVVCCVVPSLVGGVVELLQAQTSYRSGDVVDFLADTIGVILASFVAMYIYNPYYKKA
jgi:VanZ family protein